jgi:hypothetical protein
MNKKAMMLFADMHPGLMFVLGFIIGFALIYFLAMKGIVPIKGLF